MTAPLLLRRGQVIAMLREAGVSSYSIRSMLEEGKIEPVRLHDKGRAYYRRSDVVRLIPKTGD